MRTIVMALSTLVVVAYFPCDAKDKIPVKVIAPDLVVESFEFGKFPAGKSPYDVAADKVKFVPVRSRVANQIGYVYGYCVKLRTTREKVRIYNTFSTLRLREPEKGDGYEVTPIKGAVYGNWLLDGVKNGKYWVKVWVDDSELPTLTYEVKY